MIKQLQKKFIIITMGSLFGVMVILIGLINGINLIQMSNRIEKTIEILAENEGKFPRMDKEMPFRRMKPPFEFEMTAETPFETRYFIVKMNENNMIYQIDTSHIAAVSSEQALEYANLILRDGKDSGFADIYKFQMVAQPMGSYLIFLDCSSKIQVARNFLIISCMVGVVTLCMVFVLITILSKRVIRPFIENSNRQKLFITDAGHEIKTPLAIISANVDVLEISNGKNEWIASIRNQITRLDQLVKSLLTLSKMEEEEIKLSFTEFNFSELIARVTASFEPVAETKGRLLRTDIAPNIIYYGDENSMEQLISTLLDNGIKYSNDAGELRISLKSHKNSLKLEAYNTTEDLDVTNLERLFDRFYRSDSSRTRETGGTGIGLSIAKSIVEAHHGKINVRSEDGKSICFTVIL